MSKEQITLGELIDKLRKCNPESEVRFDFVYMVPTHFMSYRGYYDQLALGYANSSDRQTGEQAVEPTVSELLSLCEDVDGTIKEGYKGGEFTMTKRTPLWVANYGECGDTAIVGVIDRGYKVILETANFDD